MPAAGSMLQQNDSGSLGWRRAGRESWRQMLPLQHKRSWIDVPTALLAGSNRFRFPGEMWQLDLRHFNIHVHHRHWSILSLSLSIPRMCCFVGSWIIRDSFKIAEGLMTVHRLMWGCCPCQLVQFDLRERVDVHAGKYHLHDRNVLRRHHTRKHGRHVTQI